MQLYLSIENFFVLVAMIHHRLYKTQNYCLPSQGDTQVMVVVKTYCALFGPHHMKCVHVCSEGNY